MNTTLYLFIHKKKKKEGKRRGREKKTITLSFFPQEELTSHLPNEIIQGPTQSLNLLKA